VTETSTERGFAAPFLDPSAFEPDIADPAELRAHRKRRLALAYRVIGAMGWGSLGDGHISARDPERPDCFWLGRYGVPFRVMTTDDLVLVRPDGTIEGGGHINVAAFHIHAPVHEARPDAVSAVHFHTPYGTPFSATVTKLTPISQEACAFFGDHEIFDDEEVSIASLDGRDNGRLGGGLLHVDGALRRGSGEGARRRPDQRRDGRPRPRRVRRGRGLAGVPVGAADVPARRLTAGTQGRT
jgi:hypothetical protein